MAAPPSDDGHHDRQTHNRHDDDADGGRFLWAEAPQQWSLGAELAALRAQLAAVRVRFGLGDALAAYRLNAAEVFAGDAAAGIVVAVMLIPQALAYAQLTGMRAVTGFFSASKARMAAMSSMRLLVVSASPPHSSRSLPFHRRRAPQPPGPGLPEHAPSVKISTTSLMRNVDITRPRASSRA